MKYSISIFAFIILFITQSCQTTKYVIAKPIEKKFFEPQIKKSKIKISNPIDDFSVIQKVELSQTLKEQRDEEESRKKQIVNLLIEAETYLGTPYRMGGMSRSGIDCSGFVFKVFNETFGIELPRVAALQSKEGILVDLYDLEPGDLLFFSTTKRGISHVAIVKDLLEDGSIEFIHSASSQGVSVSNLKSTYWRNKFRFAKRIINPLEFSTQHSISKL